MGRRDGFVNGASYLPHRGGKSWKMGSEDPVFARTRREHIVGLLLASGQLGLNNQQRLHLHLDILQGYSTPMRTLYSLKNESGIGLGCTSLGSRIKFVDSMHLIQLQPPHGSESKVERL